RARTAASRRSGPASGLHSQRFVVTDQPVVIRSHHRSITRPNVVGSSFAQEPDHSAATERLPPPRDGEGGAPTPLRRSEGLKEETVTKQLRGFATMDVTKQREIARMGGKAAHAKGTAHEWSREQARLAGHKGGLARARRMEPIIAARKKNQQTP